jgi:hypothetical protein
MFAYMKSIELGSVLMIEMMTEMTTNRESGRIGLEDNLDYYSRLTLIL